MAAKQPISQSSPDEANDSVGGEKVKEQYENALGKLRYVMLMIESSVRIIIFSVT